MAEIIRMRRWVANKKDWDKPFQVGEQKGTNTVHQGVTRPALFLEFKTLQLLSHILILFKDIGLPLDTTKCQKR